MSIEHRTSNVEHSTTSKPQFEALGEQLLVRAPGKINLSLLVKGKRPDGYHNIESIMAKIDWYDEILIEHGKYEILNTKSEISNDKLETDIELICKGEYKVPEGEENLVYKAARLILGTGHQGIRESGNQAEDKIEHPTSNIERRTQNERQKTEDGGQRAEDGGQKNVQYPTPNVECRSEKDNERQNYDTTGWKPVPQVKITLTKNIPVGSGLGSGSSDAAATLMGINKFLKLGLGQKELARLAAKLGSDVVFFLDGPMALCTGRGEKVKKLEECEFRVLLIVADVSISTKRVYENYRHDEAKYRRLSEEINIYIEKKRIDLVCGLCANMLQESCFEMHPELGVLKKKIESLGIRPVGLSGSGSSMFCIINNRNEEAVNNRDKLGQELGCKSYIVNNNSW